LEQCFVVVLLLYEHLFSVSNFNVQNFEAQEIDHITEDIMVL